MQIERGFIESLQRAQDFFLFDSSNHFKQSNTMFQTRVKRQGVETLEDVNCESDFVDSLIIPTSSREKVGLILPSSNAFGTHFISNSSGRKKARMMVKVRNNNNPIDLFDFKYGMF